MESVNRKIILISLILALFTSFLVFTYIKKATATKTEAVEYVNVYVASKTLPPRHKIANDDIRQTKIAKEYLNPKAVRSSSDIVGKYLRESVIEGEQILWDRLVDEGKKALAYSIPNGKRAVSVNVNEQVEVANLLRPGDFVDVIASFDKEEIEDKSVKTVYPRVTKTIIQNAEVLALGQDRHVPDEKTKELPKTITLAVDVKDAEKLVYASEFAIIRLALRSVEDNKIVDTEGVIRSDMVSEKGVKELPK